MLQPSVAHLTLRTVSAHEEPAVRTLAALDSERPLAGQALVADAAGTPIAALELASGRTVADPFTPTAEAVRLLELRADQLRGKRERRRLRLRLRPGFAA